MKKKTIRKRILAGLLAFSLIVPANVAGAKTQTVLETNVTEASEGCTLVGVYGSYFAQAKEALAKDQTEFLEDIMQVLGDKEQN